VPCYINNLYNAKYRNSQGEVICHQQKQDNMVAIIKLTALITEFISVEIYGGIFSLFGMNFLRNFF
jgi:hypothetical protein